MAEQRLSGGSDRRQEVSSEVPDLIGIDPSVLERVPSAVLRDAISRICQEPAAEGEATAFFQSGLRHPE